MQVFIVGSGKLAQALLKNDWKSKTALQDVEVQSWQEKEASWQQKAIVIHAGSGRELADCVAFCADTQSTLIELSTGSTEAEKEHSFPFILCPNTSILMLKVMNMLQISGSQLAKYYITLQESHQQAKSSVPGTAYALADALELDYAQIESIRDPEIQANSLKIPEKYLDRHAFHRICIADGEDSILLETRVLGHGSYARGVEKLLIMLQNHSLETRNYLVLELIQKNWL